MFPPGFRTMATMLPPTAIGSSKSKGGQCIGMCHESGSPNDGCFQRIVCRATAGAHYPTFFAPKAHNTLLVLGLSIRPSTNPGLQ